MAGDLAFFRPAAPGENHAEYVDPATGRHFRVTPEALGRYRGPDATSAREIGSAVTALKRGYWSLSARIRFSDREDPDGSVRARTLDSLMQTEPEPDFFAAFHRRVFGSHLELDAPTDTVPGSTPEEVLERFERVRSVRAAAESRADPLAPLDSFLSAIVPVAAQPSSSSSFTLSALNMSPTSSSPQAIGTVEVPSVLRRTHVLLVADFARYQWRYRHDRALRHLWLDAGYLAEELILARPGAQHATTRPWRAALASFGLEAELAVLGVVVLRTPLVAEAGTQRG